MNAPNLLSFSRILFTPVFIATLWTRHGRAALLLLAFAAFTDFLDGYLARSTGTQTTLGQLLDPIADKVLMSGVFIALAAIRAIPVWFVAIVFLRDLYLLLASGLMMRTVEVRALRPNLLGKVSTVLQLATAAIFLLGIAFPSAAETESAAVLRFTALSASAAVTVLSGVQYTLRGRRYLRRVDA